MRMKAGDAWDKYKIDVGCRPDRVVEIPDDQIAAAIDILARWQARRTKRQAKLSMNAEISG